MKKNWCATCQLFWNILLLTILPVNHQHAQYARLYYRRMAQVLPVLKSNPQIFWKCVMQMKISLTQGGKRTMNLTCKLSKTESNNWKIVKLSWMFGLSVIENVGFCCLIKPRFRLQIDLWAFSKILWDNKNTFHAGWKMCRYSALFVKFGAQTCSPCLGWV